MTGMPSGRGGRGQRLAAAAMVLAWTLAAAAGEEAVSGPMAQQTTVPTTYRPEIFVGKRLGVRTGTIYEKMMEDYIPGATPVFFNTKPDAYEALSRGKIDGMMDNNISASKFAARLPGLRLLAPPIVYMPSGLVLAKGRDDLRKELNAFIAELRADGTYDDMITRWLDEPETPPMPDIPPGTGEPALRFGTAANSDGFSFYRHGKPEGFDVEFARRFAARTGRKLDIQVMDFGALIPGVASGRLDFAADLINITAERLKAVDFTDGYYEAGALVVVYDPSLIPASGGVGEEAAPPFPRRIWEAFRRTWVEDARWKLLLGGLSVTLAVAVGAFFWGSLFGMGLAALAMSRRRGWRRLAYGCITLLRGTPVVVLLMVTYFVVAPKVDVASWLAAAPGPLGDGLVWLADRYASAVLWCFPHVAVDGFNVAVLAFALNAGAYLAEIGEGAVHSVPPGQVEAARAMGFGRWGAFRSVTLPQAWRVARPLAQAQFVTTFKATAVVGFIAVIDLTKVGDIIRARTYDAFMPLLVIAAMYLTTTWFFILLFDRLGRGRGRAVREGQA